MLHAQIMIHIHHFDIAGHRMSHFFGLSTTRPEQVSNNMALGASYLQALMYG